ncbi:response regulator transcription factor [Pseudomarimonas salicorniae]|uniref:response regulator transcription factor n=1 Tax=Pseudomarimonas salicorniae TaxID=2933270 RepID=UPI003CCD9A2D
MSRSTFLHTLGYGALAGAVLLCLQLISLAPIALDWGRELIGAAIAVVAVLVGVAISRHARPRPPNAAATGTSGVTGAAAAEPDRLPELSPREQEVLGKLCRGLSNKQIARELNLSENTVKTHLGNLYAKLGVGRRTEALAVARQRGLPAEPPDLPG